MEAKNFLPIAEYLGKKMDQSMLKRLQQVLESKNYNLTIWGHYSAGKSRLLNNILGRNILPVQSRESTAFLTYILYGRKEECHVCYKNGGFRICDISDLKQIFQNADDTEDFDRISYIEVYVDHELLKTGIVLVDTPGVNTVIQKHLELAFEAMDQSGRILYVLGGAPTRVDEDFIKQIAACGIECIFVRTKCDTMSEIEENIEDALNAEKETICGFVGEEITFIPVSNEEDSKWYGNIGRITEVLEDSAKDVSGEVDRLVQKRLKVYAQSYKKELLEKKKSLEMLKEGNEEKIINDIHCCEAELEQLQRLSADIDKKVEEKLIKARQNAERDIRQEISGSIRDFEEAVDRIPPEKQDSDQVGEEYMTHIKQFVQDTEEILYQYFDEALVEQNRDLLQLSESSRLEIYQPTYREVELDNTRTIEMCRARLLQIKEELKQRNEEEQRLIAQGAEIENKMDEAQYDAQMKALDEALATIPSESVLYVCEEQGMQPSEIGKAIGEAVDLILLLLPGDAIVSAGSKVFKETGKAMKAVKNVAKAVDATRDVAYTVNKAAQVVASGRGDTENGKNYSALDMLSVAYWTEKIGAQFNHPPRVAVDEIEEANRRARREEIFQKQRKLSEQRFQENRRLGLIASKQEELEMKKKEEQEALIKTEEELARQEKKLKEESRRQAWDNYLLDYKRYYRQSIMELQSQIQQARFQRANRNMILHETMTNQQLQQQITEKKFQLESLLTVQKKGADTLNSALDECEGYLKIVEDMFVCV